MESAKSSLPDRDVPGDVRSRRPEDRHQDDEQEVLQAVRRPGAQGAEVIVTGGSVSSVNITAQGTNYALNDVLLIDDADVGGNGGSGFSYTLQSNNTGITSVTNISLTGDGYQVGDVLSVDDATVGGGGGSGFQFTVNKVGFCTAIAIGSEGNAFEASDTLILGDVGGQNVPQGSGLTLTIGSIVSTKQLEM